VLGGADNGEASLPAPLGFLSPTKCTVDRPQTPAAKNAEVSVTGSVDPNPGNAQLTIPGVVEIGADNANDTEGYTVVVTVTFDTDAAVPTQQKVLDTFRVLPVALIGAGLVGLGLLILLIMVLRSRTD